MPAPVLTISSSIFWDQGSDVVRVLVMAPLAYGALVLLLRMSGKRMLSKMSAFDLVVTIALGSTLATILLSDVSLAEGLVALGVLIALQYAVAWSAARFPAVETVIKSRPALLYFRGEFLDPVLRDENVSRDAVIAGVRQQGHISLGDVEAVVLEADGTLSIMRTASRQDGTSTIPENGAAKSA